ncbi:unnamed protein product [Brassicogethes aeneus]|uniref:non-specific serine/threonine protein kinase n=1 Tax=Brassicogethes aeneus TaxID=1431903 RepID=A0A9P0AZX5_BRAAE|nr:unnamed protein product [Brassicogethes aeneus]
MYVYNMPYAERKQLCDVLDQNNKWEELGGIHMKFDLITIKKLRNEVVKGNSPTDELLNLWGHLNHTMLELFMLLSRMKHYQAMLIIKDLVDTKYHTLIKGYTNNTEPVNHIPRENFDKSEKKILNLPKIAVQQHSETRDYNESVQMPDIGNLLRPTTRNSKMSTGSNISCVTESAGAIPQIPYDDLKAATNNWDDANILGAGGFGKVFKGTWKCTEVAIKRIEQKENNPEWESVQIKQTITELHCLNAYRHDNILPLYGYSISGHHPCLVYQYMAGGSLEERLKIKDPTKMLTWPKRLKIAIGTARGLQFLHTAGEKGLVHGDIKSANILLDPCDIPRIGDFGLAREGPRQDYTRISKIQGTPPYLPRDFLVSKKFSTKVDTYSFGVVLFELATSMRAASRKEPKKVIYLRDYVFNYEGDVMELKEKLLEGFDEYYLALIDIGKQCVSDKPRLRPEMSLVYEKLSQILKN